MKVKSSHSDFATASARGTMVVVGMVGLFLTGFIVWSLFCLGAILVALVKELIV